ncbi:MAG TPA: hypothetical protein VHY22_17115 [Chthoniobacteraceae bacterium]|jgi:hypothetical protein|nr:hypothetical protein [Chthoniobacteraceae bacterium]
MRTRFLCILGLAATCGGALFAQGPAHAVTLMGTITYEIPGSAVKSSAFTNASILKGVFAISGTTGGVTSVKDLDLAMNDTTQEIDVVVKSTGAFYTRLAVTGSNSIVLGAIEAQGKKTTLDTEVQTDFEVTVDDGDESETTVCNLLTHTTLANSSVTAINGSFSGGTPSDQPVQGEITCRFKTTKKTYDVTFVP